MFGARFYCALTLYVSAPIGGHLQVLCDKIYFIWFINITAYTHNRIHTPIINNY
jgi:hypothetical protein